MAQNMPEGKLDARYSGADTPATKWAQAVSILQEAEVFWITTVRPDGRPHVTPILAVWWEGAVHFCTGVDERKNKNLQSNLHCVLTTGCNSFGEGLDLVVEGEAVQLSEDGVLNRLADAYAVKYGSGWRFDVHDGLFHNEGGPAMVYRVVPVTVFAFSKGRFGQTRWRFDQG